MRKEKKMKKENKKIHKITRIIDDYDKKLLLVNGIFD